MLNETLYERIADRSDQLERLNKDRLNKELTSLSKDRDLSCAVAAIAAIMVMYAGGLYCLLHRGPWPLLGTAFLAEAMILAWYMGHEAAHFLAFRRKWYNTLLGEVMSFLSGTFYFPFDEYRREHIRHHIEKVDIIGVDVEKLIKGLSPLTKRALLASEWAYFPAVYFIVKFLGITEQIKAEGAPRRRAIIAILLYGALFVALSYVSVYSLLWLLLAVIIRIHVIRFVDAFQHSYDQIPQHAHIERRTRRYEQFNTYSYPVFRRVRFLNLLILNFGYHNAHHAVPGCPWYRLPVADRLLAEQEIGPTTDIPFKNTPRVRFSQILANYHRYRVTRIVSYDEEHIYNEHGEFKIEQFRGALTDNLLG
jgi:fatty acid desaturase